MFNKKFGLIKGLCHKYIKKRIEKLILGHKNNMAISEVVVIYEILLMINLIFQRNTIKRMCIKTLPPLLCIQLKRFGYDWEANRALKFDDYFKVCIYMYLIVPQTIWADI